METYRNRYVAEVARGDMARIERRLRLHDLRVLITVVQTGSMGKAAQHLATSQPAISRSIADLEHALGARLVDRNARGIEPTAYGRALVSRGLGAFDALRQGISDLEFLAHPNSGEVRVAASIAVAQGFVAAIIGRLSQRHPRLSFNIEAGDTRMACAALEEREVDLAMVHIIGPMAERFNIEILLQEPHVVVVGANSPWLRRRRVRLADLMNESWALPPPDSPYGLVVAEAFRDQGLDTPPTAVISTLPLRAALASAGRFITMVPRVVVRYPGSKGSLRPLPIDLRGTSRPLGILTLSNRTLNPVAKLFSDCAREMAKRSPR
jgi:DNA-binding transcriptional LysR family regulator